MSRNHLTIPIVLLALSASAAAQLPYNPIELFLSPDGSTVYQFSPQASQATFSYLDIYSHLDSTTAAPILYESLPFDTTNRSYIPVADDGGITVLVGDCQATTQDDVLWRFTPDHGEKDGRNGTWQKMQSRSSDDSLSANYLSAGFSFSPSASVNDTSIYVFGGMCPDGKTNSSDWISQADYSNTMLTLSVINDQASYQISVTGDRATPIPEAGLTITPLPPITASSSSGVVSRQQNFILLGGHTQQAFINMSQVALFSLPEASWVFLGVNQPTGQVGGLTERDTSVVEPRSGHTAVVTEDGSKVVVFGGWVGDVTNPATPQLAVLQVGQGYGGPGDWQWTVPTQTANPLGSSQGVYGHGAVMLPGDVMMIAGGTNTDTSTRKRSMQNYMFYDVASSTWSTSYGGPSQFSSKGHAGGLGSSQKAGLGAGLGLGLTTLLVIVVIWLLYRKRLRARRAERERHLRELAFGSDRQYSTSRVPSRMGLQPPHPEMRSASWGSRQEQRIETNDFTFPWASNGQQHMGKPRDIDHEASEVERTGVEVDVPSPTRGLRKSLSTRGSATYGNYTPATVLGPGSVFRIDEVEEEASLRSVHLRANAGSRNSDPFKDPPTLEPTSPAEQRRKEVQGWVEDWQSAAESMHLSRQPSHGRTYSNLSQAQSHSQSSSYRTGRESPEKSDRTGSNLSERSNFSVQRSVAGTVSRQISQRSVSAGYALFAGAAAAMSRLGVTSRDAALERSASKRSVSLNSSQPPRTMSGRRPVSGETRSLLRDNSPTKSDLLPSASHELNIKDYKNYSRTSSLTMQGRKRGLLGSVKRVFTGTSQVDVQEKVEHFDELVDEQNDVPEMSEKEAPGTAFWQGKKGAKDWDEAEGNQVPPSTAKVRDARHSVNAEEYDGEDWDVETAVQKRVVQVMFTMPKEKLRVVNADSLSMISRSDIDEREGEGRKSDMKRMDSVSEDQEETDSDDREHMKGKERAEER